MPEEKQKESRIKSFFKRAAGFAIGFVASPVVGLYLYLTSDSMIVTAGDSIEIDTTSSFKKGLVQGSATGIGAICGLIVGGPIGVAMGAVAGFVGGTCAININNKTNSQANSQAKPTSTSHTQNEQEMTIIQKQRSKTPAAPSYPKLFNSSQSVSSQHLAAPTTPRFTRKTKSNTGKTSI